MEGGKGGREGEDTAYRSPGTPLCSPGGAPTGWGPTGAPTDFTLEIPSTPVDLPTHLYPPTKAQL